MKNMRKLIPAIAMLLVSAVMMSTASFAWFSVATRASVDGIEVTASASGGIAIGAWTANNAEGAPKDTAFKSSIDFTETAVYKNGGADQLVPVSHGSDGTWYTAEGALVDSSAAKPGTGGVIYTAVTPGSGDTFMAGYAYYTKLDVKALVDGGSLDLYIENISVDIPTSGAGSATTTAALNKALRIAINVGSNWYYFAPSRTSSTDLSIDFNRVKDTKNVEPYTLSTSATAIAENLDTTPTTLDIYVYYDGEDPACMTAYAVDLRTSTISFELVAK